MFEFDVEWISADGGAQFSGRIKVSGESVEDAAAKWGESIGRSGGTVLQCKSVTSGSV